MTLPHLQLQEACQPKPAFARGGPWTRETSRNAHPPVRLGWPPKLHGECQLCGDWCAVRRGCTSVSGQDHNPTRQQAVEEVTSAACIQDGQHDSAQYGPRRRVILPLCAHRSPSPIGSSRCPSCSLCSSSWRSPTRRARDRSLPTGPERRGDDGRVGVAVGRNDLGPHSPRFPVVLETEGGLHRVRDGGGSESSLGRSSSVASCWADIQGHR